MATYNLSALADRTRYFMNTRNMSQDEATQKSFKDAGLNYNQLDQNLQDEYQQLIANEEQENEERKSDAERILIRDNNQEELNNIDISQGQE